MPRDVLLAGDDVFGLAHEGEREVVDIELHGELQVVEVLVSQGRQRQRATGDADALAFAEEAAANDRRFRLAVLGGPDCELDPPVVEQDAVAWPQCLDQLPMTDLDLIGCLSRGSNQLHGPAADQLLKRALDRPRADLRSLQVAQQSDGPAHRVRRLPHVLGGLAMRVGVAVREVEPRHVHARLHHRAQDLRRRARRPDGADDPRPPDLAHW